MNQKIRDFELILDENQNEHIESLKNLKLELENYKITHLEFEKLFDILNYFFKKIQYYIGGSKPNQGNSEVQQNQQSTYKRINIESKQLQNKLIDIENFIVKLINEKTALNQKYSKILDIQSKLTQSESLDNSQFHLETVKKLNEKIYDLTDENNCLKEEMKSISSSIKKVRTNKSDEKEKVGMLNEKDNIFINNMIKENIIKKEKEKEQGDINYSSVRDESQFLADNYKTLECRVLELEKELKLSKFKYLFIVDRVKSRDLSLGQSENQIYQRSRSTIKTLTPSYPNNMDKPTEKITEKKNKRKVKFYFI